MKRRARPDLVSHCYGSIITIVGVSPRGTGWLRRRVAVVPDADGTVYAEYRYGLDILTGACTDGLRVMDGQTRRIAHAA